MLMITLIQDTYPFHAEPARMPAINRKFMRMNFYIKHSAFRGLESGEDIHLMKVLHAILGQDVIF
jgi:hypothetical protein